jgi:hypothetical protein
MTVSHVTFVLIILLVLCTSSTVLVTRAGASAVTTVQVLVLTVLYWGPWYQYIY